MLYLEDYLELIEHLPLELRDRFTDIRENDLQVQNSKEQLREKVKAFFAEAQKLEPEKRQCDYQHLLSCYEQTMRYADEKVKIADQMQEIMLKLVQRLDGELEKFKLELEADHAGITEELEKRSLELDLVSQADSSIINSSVTSSSALSKTTASGLKDRRRSEHKHRHHPYQNEQDNGYHVRSKSSNVMHNPSKNSANRNSYYHHLQQSRQGSKSGQNICNMIQQHVADPLSHSNTCSLPTRDDGTLDFITRNDSEIKRNYGKNISSHTNNQSVKSLNKNSSIHGNDAQSSPYINRHSALGAALASTTTTSANSPHMNSVSPAIHYGTKMNRPYSNGKSHSNPLYISVKKSNKPNKRARHDDSHMYPDESSTSLSSDNSVFENSESVSSADYIEAGTTFGSTSPSSLDFSSNGQVNSTLYQIDEKKYCICRQVSYGEMVGCDNEECELEWFHYDCVGITLPPKGKWYCPDCRRKMAGHQQQHQHHLSTQNQKESISLVRLS